MSSAPGTSRRVGTVSSVLDAIGDTPLLSLEGIWVKLEFLNPSGSIKARVARYIIERAEREGLLNAGDIIVEASSGNTANGMSRERAAISRAFGAEVVTIGDFHVNDALAAVRELGTRPGYFSPAQFDNEWNVEENRVWLGAEILAQLPRGVVPDVVLGGIGTGGTVIGVGQAFREVNSHCQVVALEPDESCTILCGEVGKHLIEGISDGFVPGIVERHREEIDRVVSVESEEAVWEMRRLASEHGLFVGPSSGAHMIAARRLRDEGVDDVVTFLCDEGEKYLADYFLDEAGGDSAGAGADLTPR